MKPNLLPAVRPTVRLSKLQPGQPVYVREGNAIALRHVEHQTGHTVTLGPSTALSLTNYPAREIDREDCHECEAVPLRKLLATLTAEAEAVRRRLGQVESERRVDGVRERVLVA